MIKGHSVDYWWQGSCGIPQNCVADMLLKTLDYALYPYGEKERTYIPILRWNSQFHVPMGNVFLTVIKTGFLHEVISDC